MLQQTITITMPNGMHTRPAAQFVQAAKTFQSKIDIISNGKSANAKSLLKLQTLELSKNTVLTVSANGHDEQEAVKCLIELITKLK